MSSRVGGAVALAAAALLAVSMLTPWWSGHPTVAGHEQETKTVFTSLLGATGCNTGGDGSCQNVAELLPGGFKTTAFVEFMLIGIASLFAIALGVTGLIASPARKALSKLVLITAGLAAAGAVALRIQGPEFGRVEVSTYFDLGLILFALGVVCCGTASWLAARVPRARAPRPQPVVAVAPAAQQPFDVESIFRDDALRPAALGPEPRIGRPPPARPDDRPGGSPLGPGGPLPGPSGPLAPVRPSSPLFSSAPQLRPLYEADGVVPTIAPPARPSALPVPPPTPIPRENIAAVLGIPTPPALESARPPADVVRAKSTTAPPPPRSKPVTVPPPPRSRTSSSMPPLARPTSIGVAAGPAPEPNFDEPLQAMPPVPPIPPVGAPKIAPSPPRKLPTIASAVVPPPPAIVPPVLPSMFPQRPETDADPNLAALASTVGDATDANIQSFPSDDGTAPSVPANDLGTAEERAASHDEMLAPRDHLGDVPGDGIDEAETRARERTSARELGLSTSDSTIPLVKEDSVVSSAPLPSSVPDVPDVPDVPIPDPPKIVPTLTSIAKALRSHARAERERERTATNIKAAPERSPGEDTPPPERTSAPAPAQRVSAPIAAQRASAQVPAQRASGQVAAQRASAQIPAIGRSSARMPAIGRSSAQVPAQRASAEVPAQAPEPDSPRPSTQVPITTAPTDLPPPSDKQAATSGPSPACPQCESPMAWVEEHLRFYCKSCRMYF